MNDDNLDLDDEHQKNLNKKNESQSPKLISILYEKQKERKLVDKDSEILANRIALLKQEEIRTLKKIEETRKKALEVYYLKQKNEHKQQQKKQQIKSLYGVTSS